MVLFSGCDAGACIRHSDCTRGMECVVGSCQRLTEDEDRSDGGTEAGDSSRDRDAAADRLAPSADGPAADLTGDTPLGGDGGASDGGDGGDGGDTSGDLSADGDLPGDAGANGDQGADAADAADLGNDA